MKFKKVSSRPNFPELEKKILEYWEKNKIFEKSLRGQGKQQGSTASLWATTRGRPYKDYGANRENFVFYEGPPTANGRPGVHHIEARVFKDLFPRYKTMQGYHVERKAGWDTHGLPVELEVEKNLGFSSKKDIEKYGIARFNQKCAESVWKYKKDWEEMTRRIGFWLDLKNPYITCSNDYIESVWFILKQIWEKGLLYQGHKVVPYCPRCGTALSSHEVAQGYRKVTEESVYIKFKVQSSKFKVINSRFYIYFLVWTTTPWTLPGNVALALGKDIDYVLVEIKGDNKAPQPRFGRPHGVAPTRTMEPTGLILAKERLEVLEGEYKIIQEFKGKDLAGIEYEPLYPVFSHGQDARGPRQDARGPRGRNVYHTALADFVTTAEGTGIVHTAVMYGEDDYELGEKLGLPKRHTVDEEGRLKKLGCLGKWGGKFVKDAEKDIVDNLKERDLLYKSEMYTHDYPFCWRCKTPLLYYAKKSWFIKMSALREQLVSNNEKINWIPEYLKQGRFGKWLSEVKDWAVSRERYWGTPLPIWQCQIGKSQIPNPKSQTNSKFKIQNSKKHCGRIKVIGSAEELEALSGKKIQNFHRPYIDKIVLKCEKCGGEMKRVPEVLDCWFDSGAMPFAQNHWPFADAQVQSSKFKVQSLKPPRLFPADFICEAVDQTRGWFYTLLAISTLLGFGAPYKNVISLGHILDAKGRKMSKSRGNIVDPFWALDEFSADSLRWFFYSVNKPQESKNFDPQVLREIISRFILTLWNSYAFFVTYANIDKPKLGKLGKLGRLGALDRWIMSRFNGLNKNIVQYLDAYNVLQAAREIEKFVDDLSNWYIRRSRRRFWKSENDQDKKEGYATLYFVLVNLAKILAPLTPFLAEEIYRNLTGEESVHLSKFPQVSEKHRDYNLEKQMEMVRKVVTLGLNLRAKAGIKVRQPLNKFKVQSSKFKVIIKNSPKESLQLPTGQAKLLELIKEEVNVKKIEFAGKVREKKDWLVAEEGDIKVALNIKITPKLKQEGIARDLVRAIQEARKKAGFEVTDRIELGIETQDPEIKKAIKEWAEYIEKETLTQELREKAWKEGHQEKVKIGGKEVIVSIRNYSNYSN